VQAQRRIPYYWQYVHAVPQPTVFFRRSAFEECGQLDETYQFIFDFELFYRLTSRLKSRKLERLQAFYRIHTAGKTADWRQFEIELYRFSRPLWPAVTTREFWRVLQDYTASFMQRRYPGRPRNASFWIRAALVASTALVRIGNPERFGKQAKKRAATATPTIPAEGEGAEINYTVSRDSVEFRSIFCSLIWPRHPGHSGGEIRDFHLLRQLLSISEVEFYAIHPELDDMRADPLRDHLDGFHAGSPAVSSDVLKRRLGATRPRWHWDPMSHLELCERSCAQQIAAALETNPDFLFVSPQPNPVALTLPRRNYSARFVMAAYDVEAVRVRRYARTQRGLKRLSLAREARRAERFERSNLALFDGVIAVSELDRSIFVERYAFEPERVLVIENGVDTDYFAFREPSDLDPPNVMFVGNLGYQPNAQAARRLIDRIMPAVWAEFPSAALWLVGQQPDKNLVAAADGRKIVVTGTVEDVRPYLRSATVACVPLVSGAGTKYKVLEALSAGVPTVCSTLAVEGLELVAGRDLLVADTDSEIASLVKRVISDRLLAVQLAHSGRRVVEDRYSWDVNLPRLDEWLDRLRSLPKRTAAVTRPAHQSPLTSDATRS
jgi:glycosyltransferase involved in cell wall biosynthesis